MKIKLKHQQPKLSLHDLLRRRKMTFQAWLSESGVSTHAELVRWCSMVGISSPTELEWTKLRPVAVTAPADGVVVLEPPPEAPKKLPRKKKEEPTLE